MYKPLLPLKALISLFVLFQLVTCLPSGRGTPVSSSSTGKRPATSSGPVSEPKKQKPAGFPASIQMDKISGFRETDATFQKFVPHSSFDPPMTDERVVQRAKDHYSWLESQNRAPNTYTDSNGKLHCAGQMVSVTNVPGVGCGASSLPRSSATKTIKESEAPVSRKGLKGAEGDAHAEDGANREAEKRTKMTGDKFPEGTTSASWGHQPQDYERTGKTFQLKKGPDGEPVPSHAIAPCDGSRKDGTSRSPSCVAVQERLGIKSLTAPGSNVAPSKQVDAAGPAGQASSADPKAQGSTPAPAGQ
ncbi:hypothetical protein C1H76_6203 [Elsinoe australis]|uniref:Uncharacterized protein n=1 Tax=Elsinoe australis TaxID=40998 RepID=A0A4U7B316_9PEZI|nr:hypothetical protein C1H76_6203 [Elsinoe australis]